MISYFLCLIHIFTCSWQVATTWSFRDQVLDHIDIARLK